MITGNVAFSTNEIKEMLNLAIAAFERGDYITAEERAKSAQSMLLLERKGDIYLFLYLNWQYLLLSFILFTGILVIGYRKYKKSSISNEIENINKEEENVKNLSSENQKKYFSGKISLDEYNGSLMQHQNKLANLRKKRLTLRNQRIKLLRPQKVIGDLEIEKMQVEAEVKNLQKNYFIDKKITEKEYKLEFQTLNERLAEIEGERTTLELLKQKNKKDLFKNEKP